MRLPRNHSNLRKFKVYQCSHLTFHRNLSLFPFISLISLFLLVAIPHFPGILRISCLLISPCYPQYPLSPSSPLGTGETGRETRETREAAIALSYTVHCKPLTKACFTCHSIAKVCCGSRCDNCYRELSVICLGI